MRNINVWSPLERPLLGTWPTIQASALTGNGTCDPLFHRPTLNPLSHTCQGAHQDCFQSKPRFLVTTKVTSTVKDAGLNLHWLCYESSLEAIQVKHFVTIFIIKTGFSCVYSSGMQKAHITESHFYFLQCPLAPSVLRGTPQCQVSTPLGSTVSPLVDPRVWGPGTPALWPSVDSRHQVPEALRRAFWQTQLCY